MAGTERNEYRPRRARPADDVASERPDDENTGDTSDDTTAGEAVTRTSGQARRGSDAGPVEGAEDAPESGRPTGPAGRSVEQGREQTDQQQAEPAAERRKRLGKSWKRSAASGSAPASVEETAVRPLATTRSPGTTTPSGTSSPGTASPGTASPGTASRGTASPANPSPANPSAAERTRSTDQTVAESQRAERLAELRRLRDTTPGPHDLPPRADRPDIGRRQNVAEPALAREHGRGHGLVVAALAVLVVAAIVVGYLAVRGRTGPSVAQSSPAATTSLSTSMVSSRTMVSPEIAAAVADANWQIKADQPATGGDAPVPACLGERPDDAPSPTQAMVRTLTSSGNGRSILHLAQAYRTPELATEAFALVAKSLGECDLRGSYIEAARVISGLGDQATGVVLEDPAKHSYRSVVADRTGRMVNVVDARQTGSAPDIDKVATALAEVTDVQCPIAVGICASDPQVAGGPPPIGGDQPGFLAVADLPQPRVGKGTWGGLDPGSPADVVTSGCEDVSFEKLPADNRAARSYILTDAPEGMPKTFGLDEIVLSMKSPADAGKQAKTIASNLRGCEDRLPTATVGKVTEVSGTGAGSTRISGWVTTVDQKVSDKKTSHYRVGIVAAGDKLVYTFLPTTDGWDLSADQWSTVTVRAAQRATQVR